MNIHLLALPNVQTTHEYELDGFCNMTIKMAKLLKGLGHHVTLYASEENEAPCDGLVQCISKEEQRVLLGGAPYQYVTFSPGHPLWILSNPRISAAIKERKQPHDLVLTIGGSAQEPVLRDHRDLLDVEYSIGYSGTCARYRVYESYAHMHFNYGEQHLTDGRFYDAVIPCPFEAATFPERKSEGYMVYCGRLVPRKGLVIACDAARAADVPLKVIGHGLKELVTYGDYLGPLPADERNDVLSRAMGLYAPTVYIEPFGCTAPEAQLCGVPVVSTDFGGYVETVEHGWTGYRCRTMGEFTDATRKCGGLDRGYIRQRAQGLWSMEAVAAQYARYFERLQTLWGSGFNDTSLSVV